MRYGTFFVPMRLNCARGCSWLNRAVMSTTRCHPIIQRKLKPKLQISNTQYILYAVHFHSHDATRDHSHTHTPDPLHRRKPRPCPDPRPQFPRCIRFSSGRVGPMQHRPIVLAMPARSPPPCRYHRSVGDACLFEEPLTLTVERDACRFACAGSLILVRAPAQVLERRRAHTSFIPAESHTHPCVACSRYCSWAPCRRRVRSRMATPRR